MTKQEASERYQIPMHILNEYESWGLCGAVKEVMGAWQYDDTDLDRLSTILTLHDLGFTTAEVETYMRLLLEQPHTEEQRLRMLEEKRTAALDEIHFKERQLLLPLAFYVIDRRYIWFSIPLTVLAEVMINWANFCYYESRGLMVFVTAVQVGVMVLIILLLKTVDMKRSR